MDNAHKYDIGSSYTVIAHHPSHKSFNRMHTNALPQKLGFRGAFILGVANYGNMTRALVAHFGEKWLGRALIEAKFLKPVCEGDRLRVETRPIPEQATEHGFEVVAYNETMGGEVSARMVTSIPTQLPPPDPSSSLCPNEWEGPVTQKRTWDSIVTGRAYRSLRHTLSINDNLHWKDVLDDDLPVYVGEHPPLHPAQVLRQVQLGYNNQFIGDNAVHSSTKAVIRQMLNVGDSVNLLTVPLAKWEKKQNHWLTIYCAVRRRDELCAEIFHTQIIKLRGAELVTN